MQHREKFPVTQNLTKLPVSPEWYACPNETQALDKSASVGGLIFAPFPHGNPRIDPKNGTLITFFGYLFVKVYQKIVHLQSFP